MKGMPRPRPGFAPIGSGPSGSARPSPAPLAACAALGLCLTLAGCAADLAGGAAPPPPAASATAPANAGTARIVRVVHPVPAASGSYPSALYVERDVRVTARASGVIEKIVADRGASVKAGDPLAVLETDLASRDVEMADQEVRLAQAELDRLSPLHDQKIVSPQEFQRAEIARDQAATRAALSRALLDRCTVRAPFDGVVVDRWAALGQRVREEDAVPLFRVVARDPLRARVDLPEEKLGAIVAGLRATIDLPGGATREGRVVFISPAIDPASGTAPVIVETEPAGGAAKPGASVTVRFELPNPAGALSFLLPREAIPAGAVAGEATSVMVVAGGRAEARKLTVIAMRGRSFEVRGDLAAGDPVIVGGEAIAAGDRVDPRGEKTPGASE